MEEDPDDEGSCDEDERVRLTVVGRRGKLEEVAATDNVLLERTPELASDERVGRRVEEVPSWLVAGADDGELCCVVDEGVFDSDRLWVQVGLVDDELEVDAREDTGKL